MSTINHSQQVALGECLVSLRIKAGIEKQSEFARLLKITQQTVSRWERGESRPRSKDLGLIASVLSADVNDLLRIAGYVPQVLTAVFDQPFPLETLLPESFERFCLYLLSKLYIDSKVHRAGSSGHKQDGLDIEVQHPDKTISTFQCKRVAEFGPAKVAEAIKVHTKVADKKFILLTRVASPNARAALVAHSDWDLWDKEDISLKIRSLPKDEQIKLVDTFFRGQRLALLGETEQGPWLMLDDFFAPFMSKDSAFNHHWSLIGRVSELEELNSALNNHEVIVSLLTGAGGTGKSRLLRQSLEKYQKEHQQTLMRVLSVTEEVTNKSLEDLGTGTKLLVVDDAHDRDDLPLLFHFAANPKNNTQLVLSLRIYGVEQIRNQAATVSLIGPRVKEVTLKPLSLDEATDLARQVLAAYSGPETAAADIARLTRDCPLATVIGAQVVAKDNVRPELLHNEDNFRAMLLGKFQEVVTGEITSGQDSDRVSKILRVLALIQPFSPEDQRTAALIEAAQLIPVPDCNRLIKLLIGAGILFKRGGMYRISPDLLGDHIIESSCVGIGGESTGFAEHVFDKSNTIHLERILVNLGKLDWRLANGNPNNSHLLDMMWGKLKPTGDYADTHMKAMTAVAYYQPARALDFSENSIREGKVLRDLPDLIKYTAYNLEYVTRACACLWELGKGDGRALHQHPGHAIRILVELCAVAPNKPIEYNDKVVEFGLHLLDQKASWNGKYTPYDVLKGILQTEGHSTTSNGREFTFNPYFVRQEAVSVIRSRVISAAIERLSHEDTLIAVHSAAFLHDALRYPMGSFGSSASKEDYALWTAEFIETFSKIESKLKSSKLDSLVYVELLRSVSWHLNHANNDTKSHAESVVALIPGSLEHRTELAFIDGYGHLVGADGYENRRKKWDSSLKLLVKRILKTFTQPEELHSYLEARLSRIAQFQISGNSSPEILYWDLIANSPALAKATLDAVLQNTHISTARFVSISTSRLFKENRLEGLKYIKQLLLTHDQHIERAVAYSLNEVFGYVGTSPEEIAILRQLLTSKSESIVLSSINAIRPLAKLDVSLAIDLLLSIDLKLSAKVADEALMLCVHDEVLAVDILQVDIVDDIFKKLMLLPELTGHWIETFLSNTSKKYPAQTAKFFMDRVEYAGTTDNYAFRPCNFGPYLYVPLKFRESTDLNYLLHSLWNWMRGHELTEGVFHHHASQLFEVIFSPFDQSVVHYLSEKTRGDNLDIQLIGRVLNEASLTFCIEQHAFVIDFLETAKSHGQEILNASISALYRASTSGLRSGTPGEPFPRDIQAKESAIAILQNLSPLSAAYRFYDLIKQEAERNIADSLKEREFFEDN